jgi:integrase
MTTPLTYRRLLDEQGRQVQLGNLNEQTAANRATALRGFLRANHLDVDDVVGQEMRMRFPESLERFIAVLEANGRPSRSISNTRTALRPWKEAVVEHDTQEAINAGTATPFGQGISSLLQGKSIQRVAREAGIPYDMLIGWARGKMPRSNNGRFVLRLEAYFGVERNSLLTLAGINTRAPKVELGGPPACIEYNQKVVALSKFPFCIRPAPGTQLRNQWQEFLKYKTAAVPVFKRTKRGRWRFSPCPLTAETDANWWAFLDGKEIASARVGWTRTSAYLGWLCLPTEQGGIGLSEVNVHTLAWLAVSDFLEDFLNWTRDRIGKRNQGVNQFLAFVASLVRPRFGYLRQRPELQVTLPQNYQNETWEHLCDRQFELTEQLVSAYRHEIEVSRDSFEPIKEIIQLPQPMDAIADMIQRMRADRPVGQPRRESIWARDLVLIKLLISNPLRRRNLAYLTWREDNTGELYQRVDKSWWIRIPKSKFKNRHGAAGEQIYDCQVHPSAWRDIERYLFIFRPTLLREPTDLVFLAKSSHGVKEHRPWADLSGRVHQLTAKYLPRCAGARAHAFRHIVATSILKADGGDYKTAALVLNDRIQTVEKHYAGIRSNDGADRMAKLLEMPFSRM